MLAGASVAVGSSLVATVAARAAAPATGLFARYTMDKTVRDVTGHGHDATLVNAPAYVWGRSAQVLELDGASQHVAFPNGLLSTLNDFSIGVWVKPDTVTTWSRVWDFGTGETAYMFLTPAGSGGGARFAITTGGAAGEQQINAAEPLTAGVWQHVAVTLAGSVGVLYVNGREVGRNSALSLRPSQLGQTTQSWLGRSQYAADPYLDGQVDDLAVYSRALSTAEVGQLMGTAPASAFLEPVTAAPGWKIGGAFWTPRLKATVVNWIPYIVTKLADPALPEGGLQNFTQAARKLSGQSADKHVGYYFSDAYVHNAIESMCTALVLDAQGDADILAAQRWMRDRLAEWIPVVLSAQWNDGYLHTYVTQNGLGRWSNNEWHEGYIAGYFLEAAIAHYRMTGLKDPVLYDAAKRLADCWDANIGPAPKKRWWDGHEEMEQGLCRFARFVEEVEGAGKGAKYVRLARFLLDSRGGGGEYDQSHLPPVQQSTAVGHAVRAPYLYNGMTQVGILAQSPAYLNASGRIWDNLVNRKMYVTGGLGSGETSEGFGADFSLGNNSYCESCAGVGHTMYEHSRMLATGDARHADLAELTLYNAVLGGLALDGKNYTYTNPLDQDFGRYGWHPVPCCVGNIPRALLSLPTWMYAKNADSLFVNMFAASTVTLKDVVGGDVTLTQDTAYPWEGAVTIRLGLAAARKFTVRIRVPNRTVSTAYSSSPAGGGLTGLAINGGPFNPAPDRGYVAINRTWKDGDRITFTLPLPVQRVKAVDAIAADRGRVALQVGPLVYDIESVDHGNADVRALVLAPDAALTTAADTVLGGVRTIQGRFANGAALKAVPNYARNNRGGRSVVWIRDR